MITKDEWDKLKDAERYGMIAQLFKRVEALEAQLDYHEKLSGHGI